jgi:hypothetical protein
MPYDQVGRLVCDRFSSYPFSFFYISRRRQGGIIRIIVESFAQRIYFIFLFNDDFYELIDDLNRFIKGLRKIEVIILLERDSMTGGHR